MSSSLRWRTSTSQGKYAKLANRTVVDSRHCFSKIKSLLPSFTVVTLTAEYTLLLSSYSRTYVIKCTCTCQKCHFTIFISCRVLYKTYLVDLDIYFDLDNFTENDTDCWWPIRYYRWKPILCFTSNLSTVRITFGNCWMRRSDADGFFLCHRNLFTVSEHDFVYRLQHMSRKTRGYGPYWTFQENVQRITSISNKMTCACATYHRKMET